ncbi:MAG: hypothetical protein HC862_28075, partial [Scytonema sp. RU_4_4]|nr:hypothetical protein [Scytonema sp. RU_4_4]
PHVLFDYHKKLKEKDLFDTYNHYLFGLGMPEELKKWIEANEDAFNKFAEWYTQPENIIPITYENVLIKN